MNWHKLYWNVMKCETHFLIHCTYSMHVCWAIFREGAEEKSFQYVGLKILTKTYFVQQVLYGLIKYKDFTYRLQSPIINKKDSWWQKKIWSIINIGTTISHSSVNSIENWDKLPPISQALVSINIWVGVSVTPFIIY